MKLQSIRIALTMDDGSTGIMSFVTLGRGHVPPFGAVWMDDGKSGHWTRRATPEFIQAEIDRTFPGVSLDGTVLPKCLSWRIVQEADLPADRTYRNAWKDGGPGPLQHDMVKARDWHRTLLRAERGEKLMSLDGEWMRAVGQKDKAEEARIEAERQKWRDAPADPRIEAAASVEELKQIKVA